MRGLNDEEITDFVALTQHKVGATIFTPLVPESFLRKREKTSRNGRQLIDLTVSIDLN